MPRRREATKDAINCDKPRLAVRKHLTRGSPNRETEQSKKLLQERERRELKHLSTCRKINQPRFPK